MINNNSINQRIQKHYTKRNVYQNVTPLVEFILDNTYIGKPIKDKDILNKNNEILSWYIVSDELIRELNKKNETIIPEYNIWGRSSFGQLIYTDSVISEICQSLGLFEEDFIDEDDYEEE